MALVFGHSQLKYVHQYFNSSDIVTLCYPGFRVKDFLSRPAIEELLPAFSVIGIFAGANDLPGSSHEDVLRHLQELCENVHKINPRATIVLFGILPRGQNEYQGYRHSKDYLEAFNSKAQTINEALVRCAKQLPWLVFCEIPGFVSKEGIQRTMLSRDGLHLSMKGTSHVALCIEKSITAQLNNHSQREQLKQINYEQSSPSYSEVVKKPFVKEITTTTLNDHVETSNELEWPALPVVNNPTKAETTEKNYWSSGKAKRDQLLIGGGDRPNSIDQREQNEVKKLPVKSSETPACLPVKRDDYVVTNKKKVSVKNEEQSMKLNTVEQEIITDEKETEKTHEQAKPLDTDERGVTNRENRETETEITHEHSIPLNADKQGKFNKEKESRKAKEPFVLGNTSEQHTAEEHYVKSNENSIPGNNSEKVSVNKSDVEDQECVDRNEEVIVHVSSAMSHVEAVNFTVANRSSCVNSIPFLPKGNSFYIFSAGMNKDKLNDWKVDGYKWRHYGSKKKTVILEGEEICVVKKFFRVNGVNGPNEKFQKQIFIFESTHELSKYILIIYQGDESVYDAAPHGNSKSNVPFIPTKKSVLEAIKKEEPHNPVQVQNKLTTQLSNEANETGHTSVRNIRQVKNVQASERMKRKISHDSIYSLTELHFHLEDYISDIKLIPDLYVICGLNEAFEQFDKLLQVKSDEPVCLFYDTTFELGDFYVSTLSYQHTLFKESPVISLAHLIHERKFQKNHEELFNYVKRKVPRLSKVCIPIVTDREQGIINAIEISLPNLRNLLCWNHILRDVKDWLRKKGETSENIQIYAKQIRSLLESNDQGEYFDKLNNESNGFRNLWSQLFVDYYDKNLDNQIQKSAAKWVISNFQIYNPFSGITNNASEASNAKIKRLLNFREREIDSIVMFLYHFQTIDVNNILKGLCGKGDYSLKNKYKHFEVNPDEINLNKVVRPDEVIELVKGQLEKHENEYEQITNQENYPDQINDENNITYTEENFPTKSKNISQESLANQVILDKGITLVPDLGAFMVRGTRNKLYAVTLFPRETCQCPSTTRCYHIIAAMRSVGLKKDETKRVINLTKLCKRSRKNNQKKIGRKRPRFGDIDLNESIINPAPDSLSSSYQELTEINSPIQIISTPNCNDTPKSILKRKRQLSPEDTLDTPLSKKKLRFSESSCENINDLIDSSNDRRSDIDTSTNEMWIPSLYLKYKEKNEILSESKLSSQHIEAVNILMRKQFADTINGFQLPEKVPYFDQRHKRWIVGNVMHPVEAPACQIHHTHRDHWVVSFLDRDEKVYLFDSLGIERNDDLIIPNGLKIQLSLLYGKDRQNLDIIVPETQKQVGGVNCGLFAIAHQMSFCLSGKLNTKLTYDTNFLRSHLLSCFENEIMTEFPVTSKTMKLRKKAHKKTITIKNYCYCNLPECLDDMILCCKCDNWYHKNCCDLPVDIPLDKFEFKCISCEKKKNC